MLSALIELWQNPQEDFFLNNSSNYKEIFGQESKAEWSTASGLFLNCGLEDTVINRKWYFYCFIFVPPNNHLRIKGQWNITQLELMMRNNDWNIRSCPSRPVPQQAGRWDSYWHRTTSMMLSSYFKIKRSTVSIR